MPMRPLTHYERKVRDGLAPDTQARYLRGNGNTNARAIRATKRWAKVSARKRRRSPLCEDPYNHHRDDGVVVPVKDVHHIIPLEERPDLAFEETNLMSVCGTCHAKLDKKK